MREFSRLRRSGLLIRLRFSLRRGRRLWARVQRGGGFPPTAASLEYRLRIYTPRRLQAEVEMPWLSR
jgi:hypothetical protein